MLSLTRRRLATRLHNALATDVAARTILLYGAGTRTEIRLLLAQRSAQDETRVAPAQPLPLSPANSGERSRLSTLAMLREGAPNQSAEKSSKCTNLCALELYTPDQYVSAATIETHHGCLGTYTSGLPVGQCTACSKDEDVASTALTVMHRLLHRCGARPADVGVLHTSPALLDRSKSLKTELMTLAEAGAYAGLEGVDHYGASERGAPALLSCVFWAQSESWDGRWAVAMCSNDQVTRIGLALLSATVAAVLVGRGAPLQMGDARAHALVQPHFFSWLRMAPLPAGERLQELHKGHEMRATVHVGSHREVCRFSATRAVERVSADHTSLC